MAVGSNYFIPNNYAGFRLLFVAGGGLGGTGLKDTRNSYLYGGSAPTYTGTGVVSNLGNGPLHRGWYGNFLVVPRSINNLAGIPMDAFPARIGKMPVLIPTANNTQNSDGSGGNPAYGGNTIP